MGVPGVVSVSEEDTVAVIKVSFVGGAGGGGGGVSGGKVSGFLAIIRGGDNGLVFDSVETVVNICSSPLASEGAIVFSSLACINSEGGGSGGLKLGGSFNNCSAGGGGGGLKLGGPFNINCSAVDGAVCVPSGGGV